MEREKFEQTVTLNYTEDMRRIKTIPLFCTELDKEDEDADVGKFTEHGNIL